MEHDTDQGLDVLRDQGMGVVKLIQRDIDHQILLRQRHILIHLPNRQRQNENEDNAERTSRVS